MATPMETLRRLSEQIEKNTERINQRDLAIKEGVEKESLPLPSMTKEQIENLKIIEKVMRNTVGDFSQGTISIKEAIMTTDAMDLIPNFVMGNLRESVAPIMLGVSFFTQVQLPAGGGTTFVIPFMSELDAKEVGESQRYEEDSIDISNIEKYNIKMEVKKVGLKVSISDEAMKDNTFDIYAMNLRAMGRAMMRFKEKQAFNLFSRDGKNVFDNKARGAADKKYNDICTTGRGADGKFNDTMSTEDFLNLVLALVSMGYSPSDVIMHPLTWVVFSKNAAVGNGMTFGALGGGNVHPWGAIQGSSAPLGFNSNSSAGQKMILRPGEVQNRLPMEGIAMSFSPQVAFDKKTKRFDMYCLDRGNVGIIGQKEGLNQEEWRQQGRDIHNIKIRERYGMALHDDGRAVVVARNLAAAVTYPVAPEVTINTKAL